MFMYFISNVMRLFTVQEEDYIKWMAAMKLACKGRTMADTAGYQAELHALQSLLQLHHSCPSSSPSSFSSSAADGGRAADKVAVRVDDLVAGRHVNRLRQKQVRFTSDTIILLAIDILRNVANF